MHSRRSIYSLTVFLSILSQSQLTGPADGGYYESMELKRCEDEDITVYVPVPDNSSGMKQRGRYSLDEFTYDAEEDCYHCPQGRRLIPGVNPRFRAGKKYIVYRSGSADCRACPMRRRCIGGKTQVRSIRRWEHREVLERHKRRMEQGGEKMRKRGGGLLNIRSEH